MAVNRQNFCEVRSISAPPVISTSKNLGTNRVNLIQTLKCNFYFKALHVPGHYNDIADSFSRFQQTRFRRLAPHADHQPLPEELSRL